MAQGSHWWRQARGTFVGLVLGWATLSGCRPTGRRALMEGDRHLQAGRLAEALPLLERAAADLQSDGTAWNHLGRAYHEGGRVTDARKAYLRALQADRNLFDAHFNLGQLAIEAGVWKDAEAGFRTWLGAAQAGAAPSNVAAAWRGLGLAQLHQGNIADAERSLGTALRVDDKDAEAWNAVGLIRHQRRQYRDAFNTFAHAARLAPTFAAPRLNAAIVAHQNLNDRRAALEYYRAYVALNPPDAAAVAQWIAQLEPHVGASAVLTAAPSLALRAEASTGTNATPATHVVAAAPGPTPIEPGASVATAEVPPPRPPPSPPAPVAPDTPVPAATVAARPAPAPAPVSTPPLPVAVTAPRATPASASPSTSPASVTPVASGNPSPAAVASTPAVVVPPPPLEVVQVPERPTLRPASAPPASAPPASAETVPPVPSLPPVPGPVATAPAEVTSPQAGVGEAPATTEAPKASVWSRANPVSWFKRDRSPTAPARPRSESKRVTPLEFPPMDVPAPAPVAAPVALAPPTPPPAPAPTAARASTPPSASATAVARVRPVFPRYTPQVVVAPSPGDRALAQKELDPAVAAHREKDWDRAVQGYQRAIALDPACFEAQYNLSVAASERGDAALSLRAAETAVRLRPADPAARYQFAVALQRSRHLTDAVAELEEVVRLQPDNASGHLAVATVQANDLDEPARARVHYERFLALEPSHPQANAIRRWLAAHPPR